MSGATGGAIAAEARAVPGGHDRRAETAAVAVVLAVAADHAVRDPSKASVVRDRLRGKADLGVGTAAKAAAVRAMSGVPPRCRCPN